MIRPAFLRVVAASLMAGCAGVASLLPVTAAAAEAPRLIEKDGRFALEVDGKPYLILGGQVHNSSGWPAELPQVWRSLEAMHANTVAVPVYWEQMEAERGRFDFTNVDQAVAGAREHGLYVILLWFGTWKNGNMHYAPAWVKADTKEFPRVTRADGEPIDVLSPLGEKTLAADKTAFAALMRHLKQTDGERHTVLMMQVENESGNIGSVRDYSAEANRLFAGPVPAEMLAAAHRGPGSWSAVFGGEADEMFQAYYQARYINAIAAAGKAEFAIPCYANVWLDGPVNELPQRQIDTPGIAYPSGGPVQKLLGVWKALAPSLDLIGPDMYTTDSKFYRQVLRTYARPDNALWIPETGRSDGFAKFLFYALNDGAIGFSPFGVDENGWNIVGDEVWKAHARNFALLAPMSDAVARYELEGRLKTAVEEPAEANQEMAFSGWEATVGFGFPQADGRPAPGTKDAHGVVLVAQTGADEFLITGQDASIVFHLPGKKPWMRSEIVTAEQGVFENGVWKTTKLLNGDETDRGVQFHMEPVYVRVRMGRF